MVEDQQIFPSWHNCIGFDDERRCFAGLSSMRASIVICSGSGLAVAMGVRRTGVDVRVRSVFHWNDSIQNRLGDAAVIVVCAQIGCKTCASRAIGCTPIKGFRSSTWMQADPAPWNVWHQTTSVGVRRTAWSPQERMLTTRKCQCHKPEDVTIHRTRLACRP